VIDRSQRAEQAKAARREEILDAARRVFADRGFRGTTIADIAEVAGIALGTIYLYFPSKEDVFCAMSAQLTAIITGAIVEGDDRDTLDLAVRSRIDNVFYACERNRDLVRLVFLNTDSNAAEKRMRAAEEKRFTPLIEELSAAMELGTIRRADPVIMTRLVIGLVSIAVYQAFVISDGRDADKLRRECAEMVLSYMRPVKATD
jgi:AcrR family transcriptional regulator